MSGKFNGNTAFAELRGDSGHRGIRGYVMFEQSPRGVLVTARVSGLPKGADGMGVYGFHIHEGGGCSGEDFAATRGHFDPKNRPHPFHAGDLPPLFGNNGFAYMSVFTNRFTVNEIIGRTVVIHSDPDDFTSQPAGNAGEKIACGVIVRR